jgi:hypothetical protein
MVVCLEVIPRGRSKCPRRGEDPSGQAAPAPGIRALPPHPAGRTEHRSRRGPTTNARASDDPPGKSSLMDYGKAKMVEIVGEQSETLDLVTVPVEHLKLIEKHS